MADEELSRTMESVSLSAEQLSLASLATKLRDESGLSREETVLCADEFLKRMNETLPEDKKIRENQYYLTAREICQHPDNMDNTHPLWTMFTRSAQNLKEAGDFLYNVIIEYKVESMDGVPQEVTNLFVKEHAVFKSILDGMAELTPTISVMAVLQKIVEIKHSIETLVGEEWVDAQEKLVEARLELNKNIRRADVKDIDARLRVRLVEELEENAALLRVDLRRASGVRALCAESELGIVECWIGLLKELIRGEA